MQFELTGNPHQLTMPAVCVNCAQTATERVWIEHHFEYRSDDSVSHTIVTVAVPFCPACSATHRREVRVVTPLARLGMMFRSSVMWGVVCQAGLGLFFLSRGSLATTIAAVFFGLIAAVCARAAYNETRHLAVPRATSVSSAFGFSANIARLFEPERRQYTLRNKQFADALLAVNHDRRWDPASPVALRAASKRSIAIAIAILIVVALVLWSIYDEFFAA